MLKTSPNLSEVSGTGIVLPLSHDSGAGYLRHEQRKRDSSFFRCFHVTWIAPGGWYSRGRFQALSFSEEIISAGETVVCICGMTFCFNFRQIYVYRLKSNCECVQCEMFFSLFFVTEINYILGVRESGHFRYLFPDREEASVTYMSSCCFIPDGQFITEPSSPKNGSYQFPGTPLTPFKLSFRWAGVVTVDLSMAVGIYQHQIVELVSSTQDFLNFVVNMPSYFFSKTLAAYRADMIFPVPYCCYLLLTFMSSAQYLSWRRSK